MAFSIRGTDYDTGPSQFADRNKDDTIKGPGEMISAALKRRQMSRLEERRDSISRKSDAERTPQEKNELADVERRLDVLDPEYLTGERKRTAARREEAMIRRTERMAKLSGKDSRDPEEERELTRLQREQSALHEAAAPGTGTKVEAAELANEVTREKLKKVRSVEEAEATFREATGDFTEALTTMEAAPPEEKFAKFFEIAKAYDIDLSQEQIEEAVSIQVLMQSPDKMNADKAIAKARQDTLDIIGSAGSLEEVAGDPGILARLTLMGYGPVVNKLIELHKDKRKMEAKAKVDGSDPVEVQQSMVAAAKMGISVLDKFKAIHSGSLPGAGETVDRSNMSDEERYAWHVNLFNNMASKHNTVGNEMPAEMEAMIEDISASFMAADTAQGGEEGKLTRQEEALFMSYLDITRGILDNDRLLFGPDAKKEPEDGLLGGMGGGGGDGVERTSNRLNTLRRQLGH